ncbi:MAG: DUF4982 domain-containing protein [Marinilabiliaceae bacterium]|nr:DUF4982 domain-containing protein [Marinilabiliaceae bacterium]
MKQISIIFIAILSSIHVFAQDTKRTDISLNNDWVTIAADSSDNYQGFENNDFSTSNWVNVNIPHNWDQYEGYLRGKHGNRHGCSWYRKQFDGVKFDQTKRYFLFFEGVGSYANVWVNGKKVGYHAGGRTTFTIDITDAINKDGSPNILAVKADHPAKIRDLPWVCGGCSDEWGFSEGSQPMGIFRPVHLVTTSNVRVEPFGIHAWNDNTVNEKYASINVTTELKNYSSNKKSIIIHNSLIDKNKNTIAKTSQKININAGEIHILSGKLNVNNPNLWSLEKPYLYTIVTEIEENKKIIDKTETTYGIRWIGWPQNRKDGTNTFNLNGKPVFINGTAEYEHNLGQSHAFSNEQIDTRVAQIRAAGYNAYRDAHQPHNLRYHPNWDSLGMLWWPQMAAHIWFDTPEFKANFKQLLRDWIKERRNSPSIILWGLENESRLPTDYAEECVQIIREMDPTTSSQRLVTTCNGGTGTDWNVVQNWSGTYSGDPYKYDKEISEQLLNGEYGAWRSLDLHTEGGFKQEDEYSEDRMTQLMEMKIRLAESVKDKCCGQFHWIFSSHENPGRIQNGEAYRDIDRLGPVNYKGIVTPWGEFADVYYMYRSNYLPNNTEPMVYIASHTWPNRYISTGIKDSIIIYSNCDEVELYNDVYEKPLARLKHNGIGTHFTFNNINIQANIIAAIGYVNGKKVANDLIVLNHLPQAQNINKLHTKTDTIVQPVKGQNYIYRVNCGGPDYTDNSGNIWQADVHLMDSLHWGSTSWTDNFNGLPHFYASQRRTFDPIKGSNEWTLFQSYRYGRHLLKYHFPIDNGDYLVELFFIEPWYGIDKSMNCKNWRLFDIAINDQCIDDLDIWSKVGCNTAYKLKVPVSVKNGQINISFPEVKSGQAVISAIAISSKSDGIKPADPSTKTIIDLNYKSISSNDNLTIQSWLDIGNKIWENGKSQFVNLPPYLFAANWIQLSTSQSWKSVSNVAFKTKEDADIYIAIDTTLLNSNIQIGDWSNTKTFVYTKNGKLPVFTKRVTKNTLIEIQNNLPWVLIAACPVTKLEKAADQRPIVRYELDKATITNNQFLDSIASRTFVHFCRQMSPQIDWNISTGIADKYTIGIKYYNNTTQKIEARLMVETITGIKMMDTYIAFEPKGDQWKTFKIQTPSTINAGDYVVKLITSGPMELKIDYLEIQ